MRRFFCGRGYPLAVCLFALLGHTLVLEVTFGVPIILSAAAALLVSDSVLPAITPMVTLVFTLSRAHTPGVPSHSDYLFTSYRPILLGIALTVFALAAAYRLWQGLRRGARVRVEVMLPCAVLAAGLIMGGAFSRLWRAESLVFGIAEAVFFLLLTLLFSVGLQGVSPEAAADYLSYVSALIALLLSLEVAALYLGAYTPLGAAGIDKSLIVFGWGIWTSMGAALAVLIPACFIGAVRSRHPWFYFAAATAALVAIGATLSRGALIVGAFAYLGSLIAAAVLGGRRVYSIIAAVMISLALGFVLGSLGELPRLLGALFADNGRFRLWRLGIDAFLDSPLFGAGFFGIEYPVGEGYFTGADFLPPMMHSTPVQLLYATGIFGAVGYAVYRLSTLMHLGKMRSPEKFFPFFSAAVMLLLSLVENYVFQLWPLLYHIAALEISRLPDLG